MSRTRNLPRIRPWHGWVGIGALAIALIFAAWWQRQPPSEPMYRGVPLSALLKEGIAPDGRDVMDEIVVEMGADAVPYLIWAVEHGSHESKGSSLSLLRLFREKVLRRPPQDGFDQRAAAAFALGLMGPDAAAAIPVLARVRPEEDYRFQCVVASALCRIGPEAWPQVVALIEESPEYMLPVILDELHHQLIDPPDPRSVARNDAITQYALKFSGHRWDYIQTSAVELLFTVLEKLPSGPRRQEIVDQFIALLDDKSRLIRSSSANVLPRFGDDAAPSIPQLIELLDDNESLVRASAASALGVLDHAERRSVSRLQELKNDADPYVQLKAEEALRRLGVESPPPE